LGLAGGQLLSGSRCAEQLLLAVFGSRSHGWHCPAAESCSGRLGRTSRSATPPLLEMPFARSDGEHTTQHKRNAKRQGHTAAQSITT
jgi:hypothetical protein